MNRRIIAGMVFLLMVAHVPECNSQVLQDGYCGKEAVAACVRDLGVPWKQTTAIDLLEQEEFVSFQQVVDAIESLGLCAFLCSVDRSNVDTIREVYIRNQGQMSGIAWLNLDRNGFAQEKGAEAVYPTGHFVVASLRGDLDAVSYYDAETNVIRVLQIEGEDYLPLLIVSRSPIVWPGIASAIAKISSQLANSVLTTFALTLLAVSTVVRLRTGESPFRLKSFASSLLILLTLCAVGYAYSSIKVTRKNQSPSPVRELAFSQSQYDRGEVLIDGGGSVSVTLFNPTNQSVNVQDVIGSCGCMDIEPSHFSVEANGKTDLVIRFTNVTLGDNDHTVTAIVNDRPVQCTVHFQGVPNLSLVPRRQIAGKLSASGGHTLIHELKIQHYRGESLDSSTISLDSSEGPLRFEIIQPTEFGDQGKISIQISVDPTSTRRGIHFEKIIVRAGEGSGSVSCEAEIGVEIAD